MAAPLISAERVNGARCVARWVLRAVAAIMMIVGVYLVLKRLGFAIGSGVPNMPFTSWTDDLGERNSFYRGLSMIVVGAAVGGLAGRISRWVVTVPTDDCPRCGHARTPGSASACPECGMRWAGEAPDQRARS